MNNLEAPWVGREPPESPAPVCPCCGSTEAEVFYTIKIKGTEFCFGCEECVSTMRTRFWDDTALEHMPTYHII